MRYPRETLICLSIAVLVAGCGRTPPVSQPPVPKVTVSRPLARDVTDYEDFSGRIDAVSTVDVRARVTGYLVKVCFKDGEVVKKDQLLYEIDSRPFQAVLDQAKGQVERLEAEKTLLAIQVDRYRKLADKGAGSQQQFDQYSAQQAENVGALKTAKAQVYAADLNVGFTRVTAPVAGKISRTLITEGNLVAADTTLLTTIRTIDPMYAYFDIEEPTLLRIQKMLREREAPVNLSEVKVAMGLTDDEEKKFPFHGRLNFANNTLDPQTGTMQIRGVFDNPYTPGRPPALTPGAFCRVRLHLGMPHRVMLVAEQAIGTDQGQKFVFVVDQDNKVAYRRVKLGMLFDGLQAIKAGLTAGERVVVNGLQRIRPGVEVEADEVEMSALAGPPPPQVKPSGKPAEAKPGDKPPSGATAKPAAYATSAEPATPARPVLPDKPVVPAARATPPTASKPLVSARATPTAPVARVKPPATDSEPAAPDAAPKR